MEETTPLLSSTNNNAHSHSHSQQAQHHPPQIQNVDDNAGSPPRRVSYGRNSLGGGRDSYGHSYTSLGGVNSRYNSIDMSTSLATPAATGDYSYSPSHLNSGVTYLWNLSSNSPTPRTPIDNKERGTSGGGNGDNYEIYHHHHSEKDYYYDEYASTNGGEGMEMPSLAWWIGLIFSFFLVYVFLSFLVSSPLMKDDLSYEWFPHGAKIQLFLPTLNNVEKYFLRVDTAKPMFAEADNNNNPSMEIIADTNFPWLHGSTFEISRNDKDCFHLKSMKNLWLYLDYATGKLKADGITRLDGSSFGIKIVNEQKKIFHLKLCNTEYYFEFHPQRKNKDGKLLLGSSASFSGTTTTNPRYGKDSYYYSIQLTEESFQKAQKTLRAFFGSLFSNTPIPTPPVPSNPANPSNSGNRDPIHQKPKRELQYFSFQEYKPIQGVNLGGWFIPEYWMNPSFFQESSFGWWSSLCRFKNSSKELVEQKMIDHLASWITEKDFEEISSVGLTSIRVPVGYWNIIEDPYQFYSPSNLSLSEHYLHWTFKTAKKYNLTVLIDIHGGPGSQNGIDHSGCNFYVEFDKRKNILLALDTVQQIMIKYSHYSNFLGVELLNEPSLYYSSWNHTMLVNYYTSAYKIIRSYHSSCHIWINELYEHNYMKWKFELQEPSFYNVIMDYHLYNWQYPYTTQTTDQHLQNAENWKGMIEAFTVQHPIVVGEWSMSTGVIMQVGQPFVNQCVKSFQKSFGYYLWNWKIDRQNSTLYDNWDVQYQLITKGGKDLNPLRH